MNRFIGHASESSVVSKPRRGDRANCPSAVTVITSVQLHQNRERIFVRTNARAGRKLVRAHAPIRKREGRL